MIGLKPREYYLLTPYEFWCISEGYKYKEAQESALVRKHAQVIYRVMGGEDDLSKYWPIPLIDGEPLAPPTREEIAEMMASTFKRLNPHLK